LAVLFFKQISISWQSQIFDMALYFQDGVRDILLLLAAAYEG